jgi:tetraacyldisaccharide 4'-kinase
MGNDHSPPRDLLRMRVVSRLAHLWNTPPDAGFPEPWLTVLRSASKIYGKALHHAQQRAMQPGYRQHLPALVISIGNLVTGGTGKTPLTLWLARHLVDRGRRVAVLSRGYGRQQQGVSRVATTAGTRSQVRHFGDEPVLLATKLADTPVWVGRQRSTSGRAAIHSSRAEILILDDGFQHLALYRDLDLVLLDADNPWGNGALLPLGPLREPLEHLTRADALILTRAADAQATQRLRAQLHKQFQGKPIFACQHRWTALRWGLGGPALPVGVLRDQPVLAFAGIARPASFLQMLRGSGLKVVEKKIFPDHHFYRPHELAELLSIAAAKNARFLVTTEKDAVRLPKAYQAMVVTVEIEIDFGTDRNYFITYLEQRLRAHPPAPLVAPG